MKINYNITILLIVYFSNKNNFFHGIMFHHFHDDNLHKKGQGSINQDKFYKLIKFIGRENILDANEFFIRYKENKLTEKNLCITFDDGIKCQYDIALPVLEDLKIKSFFFVYSTLLKGEPDLLEVYSYFRMNYFKNVDEFYENFFNLYGTNLDAYFTKNKNFIKQFIQMYPFYSINDTKFRLVRDKLLSKDEYKKLMFKMFKEKNFEPKDHYEILFISNKHIVEMRKLGHLIGLHSNTHPALLEKLSFEEQTNEYSNNITILSESLKCDKKEIKYMSHPNGSYNQDTLKILKTLGIELGFKEIMTIEPKRNMKKINNSFLEIARQDSAEIIKMMN